MKAFVVVNPKTKEQKEMGFSEVPEITEATIAYSLKVRRGGRVALKTALGYTDDLEKFRRLNPGVSSEQVSESMGLGHKIAVAVRGTDKTWKAFEVIEKEPRRQP